MEAADMDCCLKVHPKCPNCMGKTLEVLQSIVGVYSVTWDAEKDFFRISGEVDPNILLRAVLLCTSEHAELVSVKLKHPKLRLQNYNNYGPYGGGYVPPRRNGYNYGSYGGGYLLPSYMDGNRSLPYHPYDTNDQYGMQRMIEYPSSCNNSYAYQNPLPPATYVPSNPYKEYNPNDNLEGISMCTIM